ncbi:MAG: hypothetical protein M1822_002470 [Bathelium mastoideum]|nr:MAG: hypothetical protein M1822_002470 [Bathelium mastoideum]
MTTQVKESDSSSNLSLIPPFLKIFLALDYRLLTSPFRRSSGARTYYRDVSYAVLRTILSDLTCAQTQRLTPSTSALYNHTARALQHEPDTVDLGADTRVHWIGPRTARYVLLFFHGGGYIGSASPGHWRYQFALRDALAARGHDVAVLSLAYTLAPRATYPAQLAQAVAALRYLLETEGRAPETVLLAGDSAGGNLVCALLMHLARPHPMAERVPVLELGEGRRLRGAVLISPWVEFGTTTASFRKNRERDYITVRALHRASSTFVGMGGKFDLYSHPSEADEEAWRDVAGKVGDILIWGGGGEILIDGIRNFAEIVKKGFAMAEGSSLGKEVDPGSKETGAQPEDRHGEGGKERLKFVETPEMAHEEMIIDRTLRIKGRGQGEIEIENWISSVL